MLETIKNIYNSPDLPGEIFLQPLKAYVGFSVKKISECDGLKKGAYIIAFVAFTVLASPSFVVLATVGMIIKPFGIRELKRHNEERKVQINGIQTSIKNTLDFSIDSGTNFYQGRPIIEEYKFLVRKYYVDDITPSIRNAIDILTSNYRRVFVNSKGELNNGFGEIEISIGVVEYS